MSGHESSSGRLPQGRRLVFAALLVLVVASLGAGALWWRWHDTSGFESDNLFSPHPELGHVLRPGVRDARMVVPGRPHPLPFNKRSRAYTEAIGRRVVYRASTNALGLRGPEVARKPDPSRLRVALLGDSITFGFGVDDADCYAAQLQRELDRRASGRYEVVNAGVHGYDSRKVLAVLRDTVLPLSPRVVCICVGVNDTGGVPEHTMPERLKRTLAEDRYREMEDDFRDNVTAAVNEARATGAEVVLMVPPANSFYPFPDVQRFLRLKRQIAREQHAPMVDLARAFAEVERRDGLVLHDEGTTQRLVQYKSSKPLELLNIQVDPRRFQYVDDRVYTLLERPGVEQRLAFDGSHPNRAGHRLIAERLAQTLLSLSL